jgi:hypothetical protein
MQRLIVFVDAAWADADASNRPASRHAARQSAALRKLSGKSDRAVISGESPYW